MANGSYPVPGSRPRGRAAHRTNGTGIESEAVVGILLGVVFGAANACLGLRVGLTVSDSITVAVMAIATFRVMRRGSTLETNVVQTIGSAGESLAAGSIFTLPALYIWGFDVEWYVVATVAFLGAMRRPSRWPHSSPLPRASIWPRPARRRRRSRLTLAEGCAGGDVIGGRVSGPQGDVRGRHLHWRRPDLPVALPEIPPCQLPSKRRKEGLPRKANEAKRRIAATDDEAVAR
jgi:hypothetical protein